MRHGGSVTDPQTWKDKYAQELFTYERLMARSIQTNSMQWQAPSLALAAQAFLLTIALRAEAHPRQQRPFASSDSS
jgi:catalase (peroxidase I)